MSQKKKTTKRKRVVRKKRGPVGAMPYYPAHPMVAVPRPKRVQKADPTNAGTYGYTQEFIDYMVAWVDAWTADGNGTQGAFREFGAQHGLLTTSSFAALYRKAKGRSLTGPRGGSKDPAEELRKLAEIISAEQQLAAQLAEVKKKRLEIQKRCAAYLAP